jgi:hypothetical protein
VSGTLRQSKHDRGSAQLASAYQVHESCIAAWISIAAENRPPTQMEDEREDQRSATVDNTPVA